MELENRTPHPITIHRQDGSRLVLPAVKPPVRLDLEPGPQEDRLVAGLPVHSPVILKGVVGLPPRREGVLVLVSQLAALAVQALHPERDDVVHPATGPRQGARRDGCGTVLGVRAVVRAA